MKKICKKCGGEKHISKYSTYIYKGETRIHGICKVCKSNRRKKRRNDRTQEEKGRDLQIKRNSRFIRKYGITLKEYWKMVEEQGSRCAICNQLEIDKELLSIDHDHDTGKVRGLLCHQCNTGLGKFGDNIEGIKKVLQYLRKRR